MVTALPTLAINPQPEPPGSQAVNTDTIKSITKNVHQNYRIQVLQKKKAPAPVLQQQLQYIIQQPAVKIAKLQPGGNIFVEYKNGYKMLMMLGKSTFGAALPAAAISPKATLPVATATPLPKPPVTVDKTIIDPGKIIPNDSTSSNVYTIVPNNQVVIDPNLVRPNPIMFLPNTPSSRKALIFNTMRDQAAGCVTMGDQINNYLAEMGFQTTIKNNDSANLAAAANMDNDYGMIFFAAHGGVVNNDFYFMVRPYYTSPPAWNSGYTGTIVFSVDNWVTDEVNYVYAIGSQFAAAYWNDHDFPKTIWADCSCSSSDPAGMNGLPKWVVDHGSAAWVGWNAVLGYNPGTLGTPLFFDKLRGWKTLGQAAADVKAAGYTPPDLTIYPTTKSSQRLPMWKSDVNEPAIADGRDFADVRMDRTNNLTVQLKFYAAPTADEFFMYADTGGTSAAEICVKCHAGDFQVYKLTSTGGLGAQLFSGTPSISGSNYNMIMPYATCFGTVQKPKFWFYDMTSKDRLPDMPVP